MGQKQEIHGIQPSSKSLYKIKAFIIVLFKTRIEISLVWRLTGPPRSLSFSHTLINSSHSRYCAYKCAYVNTPVSLWPLPFHPSKGKRLSWRGKSVKGPAGKDKTTGFVKTPPSYSLCPREHLLFSVMLYQKHPAFLGSGTKIWTCIQFTSS